jgi:hypothetical protein
MLTLLAETCRHCGKWFKKALTSRKLTGSLIDSYCETFCFGWLELLFARFLLHAYATLKRLCLEMSFCPSPAAHEHTIS